MLDKIEPVKAPKRELGPVWSKYRVSWQFLGKLCGSVPQQPDMIDGWINAQAPKVRPPNTRSMREIQEEVFATLPVAVEDAEDQEERVTLGFQAVEGRLVMRGGTVRAHYKDCARILSSLYVGKIQGEKSFAVKVVNSVYVEDYWIPILRDDGTPVTVADGAYDKAVHVMTSMGQRNALKRIQFVTEPRMVFTVKVLGRAIGKRDLETIMEYGAVHGYAGERSDGEGRYTFEITEAE